jgi:hypothetical protein
MSVHVGYLDDDSLTKNAVGDLAISACATCLLAIAVHEFRSAKLMI